MPSERDNCQEEDLIEVPFTMKNRKRKSELLAENDYQHEEPATDESEAIHRRKRRRKTDSSSATTGVQSDSISSDMVDAIQSLASKVTKYKRLFKDAERSIKNLEAKLQHMGNRINQIELENEKFLKDHEKLVEKEECRRLIFLLKDLASYQNIASKLMGSSTLDHNERRTLQHHHEREREIREGTEQKKRDGLEGLFDAQNCDGHSYVTSKSIDECYQLLEKRPNIYSFYGIQNWSLVEMVDFIESSREAVEQVNQFVKTNYGTCQLKSPQATRKRRRQNTRSYKKKRNQTKRRQKKRHAL